MVAVWRACLGDFDISDADLELMRHLYSRSIRLLDDWVARLLQRLDDSGHLDDTLVIVTSDHGENFGEGQLIGHAFSLDQRLIRVPFVAAGPGAPILDRTASLVELPRLLADSAGLQDHPWGDSQLKDGIAVAQFDAPADRDDPKTIEAGENWGLDERAMRRFTTAQTAATDGSAKLVRDAEGDRFFDLAEDPLEQMPLHASNASSPLRKALERAAEARSTVVHGRSESIDHDLEERMRLLGYA
jgi:arylsulfatase A-like enzyme